MALHLPTLPSKGFTAARDHTGPAPLRCALTLSWDGDGQRTLYAYPTSFRTAAEATSCARRLLAEGVYDAFALTETGELYTAAAPLTVTTRATAVA